ncbi:MAG: zinc ribbon domain-containing protein [Gemmatimonadota bacterium]
MHPQLEILLEMQDLRSQKRALKEQAEEREVESDLFEVEIEDAVDELDRKLEELQDRLDDSVQATYRRVSSSMDRAVVPVLNGVCYGCFIAVPRSWASEAAQNEEVITCENCGRFLYYVD